MYSVVTSTRWKNKYLVVRKGLGATSYVIAETPFEDYANQIATALARYHNIEEAAPAPVIRMRGAAGGKK
jgi:hypothetical protein